MNNVELTSMNNVELANMNNVELVNMNNVLASMFYRFPTILLKQERTVLFIHPLNGQPHLILNFIFCRIMTMREMLKSNLKYRLQREFWRKRSKLTVMLYSVTTERLVILFSFLGIWNKKMLFEENPLIWKNVWSFKDWSLQLSRISFQSWDIRICLICK